MITLKQSPEPDQHLIRFCGECVNFKLELSEPINGKAYLRTNLNKSDIRYEEIIKHAELDLPPLNKDWYDIPMDAVNEKTYSIQVPLNNTGRFEAKAYWRDENDNFSWPIGCNTVIKIEPVTTFSCNTMYTAFVRLFGSAKNSSVIPESYKELINTLDDADYTVLPPSGKFRDLIDQLDFIIGQLRCRIIQLLPIHPTPSTYARMGRYGSPFAALDLFDVDPALAVFDKTTTPLSQFQELINEIHYRNALIFIDMPINHTGWASHLQNHHPEWFIRNDDDCFRSPGAWGIVWEDLSKLDYQHRELWKYMADVFLFWCKKGIDGFRCDAGYKIPFEAWNYIIAKVRIEYPDTIFMLEGLGGDQKITEKLLCDAGMNWAYSEIFQNYDKVSIENYLPQSYHTSNTFGNLIHFAETHDNDRLASTSFEFAKLRMGLCALSCVNGAFGFSNGVEWLATKKINVHNAYSLNWNADKNLVYWIQRLNAIIEMHPCFHPYTKISLIPEKNKNIVFIFRECQESNNQLLICANLDLNESFKISNTPEGFDFDLCNPSNDKNVLLPGEIKCLSNEKKWLEKINEILKIPFNNSNINKTINIRKKMLEVATYFEIEMNYDYPLFFKSPFKYFEDLIGNNCIVRWNYPDDQKRTVMIPPDHILIVSANKPFLAEIKDDESTKLKENSIQINENTFISIFLPLSKLIYHKNLMLNLTLLSSKNHEYCESSLLYLSDSYNLIIPDLFRVSPYISTNRMGICTNDIGTLSFVRSNWSQLKSKYDGLLHANLNKDIPTDRHTMLTRCRAWVLFNGFSTELNANCQTHFGSLENNSILWHFNIPIGQGFIIQMNVILSIADQENGIQILFERCSSSKNKEELPGDKEITLIIRPDIEDRNSHHITRAHEGAQNKWPHVISNQSNGFIFEPNENRRLNVKLSDGNYIEEPEWYYNINHEIDIERKTDGYSDLFSPGYFQSTLLAGDKKELIAGINCEPIFKINNLSEAKSKPLIEKLSNSINSFIVNRNSLKTVIAGYPWFLDWGRDSLICLRGIIAAKKNNAEDILIQFASFEKNGTLPNMINGTDDANRETSDAPLWMFVVCNDLVKQNHNILLKDCNGRTMMDVLTSIVENYVSGTGNGIVMDKNSGLIFSPSHFTWMDTNYPAATPREGYPIEIQALWHFALSFLHKTTNNNKWKNLSDLVLKSIMKYFIIKDEGFTYLADNLKAEKNVSASKAIQDDSLRCNQLFAVTLISNLDNQLSKNILSSCEQLLIPGAIRSLANKTVKLSSPIYLDGELINNPKNPYFGYYTGEEDKNRKPAYHNGTAWTWVFPTYCEALLLTYGLSVKNKVRSLLNSSSILLEEGCIDHLPEILDGNAPHVQRGCSAQAWSSTEFFRVFSMLN